MGVRFSINVSNGRGDFTPFSCKNPVRDEQAGPPFVLVMIGVSPDSAISEWRLPEYEVVFVALRCWWEVPEK